MYAYAVCSSFTVFHLAHILARFVKKTMTTDASPLHNDSSDETFHVRMLYISGMLKLTTLCVKVARYIRNTLIFVNRCTCTKKFIFSFKKMLTRRTLSCNINSVVANGGLAQLARASGSYPGGRGFDPLGRHQ